jgi:hypothetical protein
VALWRLSEAREEEHKNAQRRTNRMACCQPILLIISARILTRKETHVFQECGELQVSFMVYRNTCDVGLDRRKN